MFSGVQQESNGLAPIATNQSGTVTVSVVQAAATYQLVIPSLHIDVTVSCCDEYGLFGAFTGNYVNLGWWGKKWTRVEQGGTAPGYPASEGLYLYGYETPASAMPTSGQANFPDGHL
jgi:hypothetical protein